MRKYAHVAVVTSLLLAGCAAMHSDHYVPRNVAPCTRGGSDICIIDVTVNACSDSGIVVSPEDAKVDLADVGDVMWRVGGRWRFASNGIVFKHPHSDFSNPRGGNTSQFRWHNAHTVKHKTHKYKVVVTDGTQTCEKDPSIMN